MFYITDAGRPPSGRIPGFICRPRKEMSSCKDTLLLERSVSDPVCDHYQHKRADYKSQINLPAELQPGSVIDSAHGQLNHRAAGPEAVRDSVAVLIRQHQYLLVDIEDLSQRLQDRHDNNSLAASRYYQEIKERHKYKYNQKRKDRALVLQKLSHSVYDGIHNACLIHQHDYRLGKSHRECRGKYPDRAFTEELARLAGPEPENDRQQDSHDYIDRRNLGEGPSQSDSSRIPGQ